MRRFVFAMLLPLLLLYPKHSLAEDLYCDGKTYLENGSTAKTSIIFSYDKKTLNATVETYAGLAKGALKKQTKLYLGKLSTNNGHEFWINLNRFNGEFILLHYNNDGYLGQVEFSGFCKYYARGSFEEELAKQRMNANSEK